jgi:hypothetical protein
MFGLAILLVINIFYKHLFKFQCRLRSQTELVKLNKEMEKESESIQDLNRQITVLVQKQMRIKSM